MTPPWQPERHPEITSPRDGDGWARLPGTAIEVQTFMRSGIPWVRYRAVPGTVGARPFEPDPAHEVVCPQCGTTIRARMADAPGVRPYDGAVLVVTPETPDGGVTMVSNDAVVHFSPADLEPDVVPTEDEVREAHERFRAGRGTYADYMTMSRANLDDIPHDDAADLSNAERDAGFYPDEVPE